MSNIDTPISSNNAKKITLAPNTSSPKLPCISTPPNSTELKRIDKTPLSSSLSSSPVSAISSYLKHLLGINAKTTKRSINEEAECGSPDSIEEWIHKGSNPNEIDAYGYTPLINASLTNCIKSVKVLIKNGADVNMKASHGYTALHVASQNGHVELAEILINNGADLEIKNDDGDTALMLAVRSEHSTLVDLLCKHGCNRHALGFDHIDPIDYAINKRNQYLSDVLLKHERKLYTPVSQCGSSPLNESSSLGPNLHNSIIDDLKSDSSIQHEDTANKSLNLDSNYSVFQSD